MVDRRAAIGWSWWTPEECLDFTQCKWPNAAHVTGAETILLLWMLSYFYLPNYLYIFLSLFLRLKQRVSVFNLRWAKMYPNYLGQSLVKDDKITWILLCIHSIRSFNFNLVCDKKPSCCVIVLLTPHLHTATTCEQFLCETISKSHLPGETPTLLRFPLPWWTKVALDPHPCSSRWTHCPVQVLPWLSQNAGCLKTGARFAHSRPPLFPWPLHLVLIRCGQ